MAAPKRDYLEKGTVFLTQEEWDTLQGDGTKENPYTVILEGSNKRTRLSGTLNVGTTKDANYQNLVNGVIVAGSRNQSVNLESPEVGAADTVDTADTGTKEKPDAQTARDKFGIGEALLNDKKYGKKGQKGGLWEVFELWKAGKFTEAQDVYFATDWAKLDQDVKDRYLLALENDNLYKERLTKFTVKLRKTLAPYGIKIDDAKVKDYYDRGIDEEVILDELIGGVTGKTAAGTAADALDTLRTTARNNGFNLDRDFGNQVDDWLRRISRGEDVDDFKRLIRQQAKLGLPEKVGTLLDEGLDLSNVFAPYRNTMAALLEVTPDSINLDDPLLRSAYGPDKETSIYDFKRAVRKDPRWQYTDNAREEVSTIALNVLRDFGFQG